MIMLRFPQLVSVVSGEPTSSELSYAQCRGRLYTGEFCMDKSGYSPYATGCGCAVVPVPGMRKPGQGVKGLRGRGSCESLRTRLGALVGFGFVTTVAASGPSWTDIMTAFGTVGAVVAAVGIALWAEWRSGQRLKEERERSVRLVEQERARRTAQIEEERRVARERELNLWAIECATDPALRAAAMSASLTAFEFGKENHPAAWPRAQWRQNSYSLPLLQGRHHARAGT